jgi:hypothetical protein
MSVRALVSYALACSVLISCFAHADAYRAVRIVAPKPDATVHDNSGNLAVTVAVSPPLRADSGDHLALQLDGRVVSSGFVRRFELAGIDRGSHTLRAQVIGADGSVIASSPPVIFHMWQASRLFPGRKK